LENSLRFDKVTAASVYFIVTVRNSSQMHSSVHL